MNKNRKKKSREAAAPFMVILCILLSFTGLGGAENRAVPPAAGRIHIDGKIDEAAWQDALLLELNYEVRPGENIPAPVATEVLLLYSRSHLYAAFRAYDPEPAAIRAVYVDRDHFPDHDWVGIVLDTFNDQLLTFNFYCNPYGIQADGIMTPDRWIEWDGIWDSAGRITDRGYTVEMAIPFSCLRFRRSKGDLVWGIDLVRNYPRRVAHQLGLFPVDRGNNCYMCQFKKITGFAGAVPGKNIEIAPTISTILTRERDVLSPDEDANTRRKISPGLTARWGITPNLNLSAAVTPDFSNVEADVAQLDINTQFALFYPEKRPFFLEDGGVFGTRINAVHTRSMAEPDWGIKLTGKEGKHNLGFFSVQDSITNLLLPGSQASQYTSLQQENIASVLRYRFDMGNLSTLGLLCTSREGDDYFNRLLGIDGEFLVTKRDRVSFQVLGSQTRYPGEVAAGFNQPDGKFSGTYNSLAYLHEARSLDWYISYDSVSDFFRSDLGFNPQVGFRRIDLGTMYTLHGSVERWYTGIDMQVDYRYLKDRDDLLLQHYVDLTCHYRGPLQSFLITRFRSGREGYMGREFAHKGLLISGGLRPSGVLNITLNGLFGDKIDYTNKQSGRVFNLNPAVEYKIGRHLFLGLDHLFERLRVAGGRLYTANISNIKLVYQFNRRTFLRTILQYVHYDYNTRLYTIEMDPQFKHLFSQVLFSYKINPRTVFFLGYSDDHYGYSEIPMTPGKRTFFLKIGYSLVL